MTAGRFGLSTAPLLGQKAQPAAKFTGDVKMAVWLPNERVAKAWGEYEKDGNVSDKTPPSAPTDVCVSSTGELRWENGDAPTPPLPEMRYNDDTAAKEKKHTYTVRTVNTVGLESKPTAAITGSSGAHPTNAPPLVIDAQWQESPRPVPIARHMAIQLDTNLLNACVDNYEFAPSSGGKITIRRERDHLQMRLASGAKPGLDMYPISETDFFLKIDDSLMTFIKDDKGEVTRVIHHSAKAEDGGSPPWEKKYLSLQIETLSIMPSRALKSLRPLAAMRSLGHCDFLLAIGMGRERRGLEVACPPWDRCLPVRLPPLPGTALSAIVGKLKPGFMLATGEHLPSIPAAEASLKSERALA